MKTPPERVDLLARLGPRDVRSEPFPHVIVRFALPEETVDTLIESLPPQKTLTAGARPGSNRRFSLPARDALRSDAVGPLWRDLLLTAGLFYLRGHADDSTGGELEICRFRAGPRGFRDAEVADRHGGRKTFAMNPGFEDFETATDVPFLGSRSLLFLNGRNAWHGVKRLTAPPGVHRRLFNVIFDRPGTRLPRLLDSAEAVAWRLARPLVALGGSFGRRPS